MHIDAREEAKRYPGALEASVFTDLNGVEHRRAGPLSILEFNRLEYDWQLFLADAASGALDAKGFEARARAIVEQMGWPAAPILALPNDVFWAVMNRFFVSPAPEGKQPVKTETETVAVEVSSAASTPTSP